MILFSSNVFSETLRKDLPDTFGGVFMGAQSVKA